MNRTLDEKKKKTRTREFKESKDTNGIIWVYISQLPVHNQMKVGGE